MRTLQASRCPIPACRWLEWVIAAILASAALHCLAQHSRQTPDPPHVTFVARDATALHAILQMAQQTRQPLGIIFGENPQRLCEIHHAFQIRTGQIRDALDQAILDTGYSIRDEDDILILQPPDLISWQQTLLDYHYESFSQEEPVPMSYLAAQLTGWMWAAADPAQGYGGSILHSLDDEKVHLGTINGESTEQIANRIVNLGSKGVWMLKPNTPNPKGPTDEQISIDSYHDDALFLPRLTCAP